ATTRTQSRTPWEGVLLTKRVPRGIHTRPRHSRARLLGARTRLYVPPYRNVKDDYRELEPKAQHTRERRRRRPQAQFGDALDATRSPATSPVLTRNDVRKDYRNLNYEVHHALKRGRPRRSTRVTRDATAAPRTNETAKTALPVLVQVLCDGRRRDRRRHCVSLRVPESLQHRAHASVNDIRRKDYRNCRTRFLRGRGDVPSTGLGRSACQVRCTSDDRVSPALDTCMTRPTNEKRDVYARNFERSFASADNQTVTTRTAHGSAARGRGFANVNHTRVLYENLERPPSVACK
ncbi:hypothetical protein EXIGLDRAFT_759866, partial [Exidia glandulosa HHB12029]